MLIDNILDIGSKIIDRLIPDKNAADAAKLKLIELEQAGEFKQIESQLEQERIDALDRASARAMAMNNKDKIPEILSLGVTLGFFVIVLALMFFPIPENIQRLIDVMVGYLGANVNQVFTFYFGSSKSSRMKDDTIAKLSAGDQ
jgi:hypothetical protein